MMAAFEMPAGRSVTIVAWGIEEKYETRSLLANKLIVLDQISLGQIQPVDLFILTASKNNNFQGKGKMKGRDVMGGRLHSALDGVFLQMDVRGIWHNDPGGSSDWREMVVSPQSKECVNVCLSMVFAWLIFGTGPSLIFSVTCPGLSWLCLCLVGCALPLLSEVPMASTVLLRLEGPWLSS